MNIFEILKNKRLSKEQKLQIAVEGMLNHSQESTRRTAERLISTINTDDWTENQDPAHLVNTIVIAVLEHEASVFKNILAKSKPAKQIEQDVNNIKSFL